MNLKIGQGAQGFKAPMDWRFPTSSAGAMNPWGSISFMISVHGARTKAAFHEPMRAPHPDPLPQGEGTTSSQKMGTRWNASLPGSWSRCTTRAPWRLPMNLKVGEGAHGFKAPMDWGFPASSVGALNPWGPIWFMVSVHGPRTREAFREAGVCHGEIQE